MRQPPTFELGGHEVDGEDLVGPAHPAAVHLAVVQRLRLHELLEHDAVLTRLARRYSNAKRLQLLLAPSKNTGGGRV